MNKNKMTNQILKNYHVSLVYLSRAGYKFSLVIVGLLMSLLLCRPAPAEDWPTYRHDNRRSGVTNEKLELPLKLKWTYEGAGQPQTAWPGPAKWDSFANLRGLKSMRNFDPAFYVTVVENAVTFGSSVDDAVHCLDAKTGREKWMFVTDGPVRLPPSWSDDKVYFGSDDGYVYCVNAKTGEQVWKYNPSGDDHFVPSNGKMISLWPCRTGVLVQDGRAYFGASLLPWETSYLCALDSVTGADSGPGLYKAVHRQMTMQGAMLGSPEKLYISQGRQSPIVCEQSTGRKLGSIGRGGDGGVYALLTEDETLIHGLGQSHRALGELRGFDGPSRDYIATFPGASAMVCTGKMAYLLNKDSLAAFDRVRFLDLNRQINKLSARTGQIKKRLDKEADKLSAAEKEQLETEQQKIKTETATLKSKLPDCYLWKAACSCPHELILAGETLIAGGDNQVAAFSIRDGKQLWIETVKGKAHGLTVANGTLYVSTDRGKIFAFVK